MRHSNQERWRTFKRGVPGRKNLKTHDRGRLLLLKAVVVIACCCYIMGGCSYCIMVYHARRKVLSRRDVCKIVQLHVNVQIGKIVIQRYFIIEDEEDQAGGRSHNSTPCELPQTHARWRTFKKGVPSRNNLKTQDQHSTVSSGEGWAERTYPNLRNFPQTHANSYTQRELMRTSQHGNCLQILNKLWNGARLASLRIAISNWKCAPSLTRVPSFPLAGCWNPTQAAEKNEGGTGKGAIADENASGSAMLVKKMPVDTYQAMPLRNLMHKNVINSAVCLLLDLSRLARTCCETHKNWCRGSVRHNEVQNLHTSTWYKRHFFTKVALIYTNRITVCSPFLDSNSPSLRGEIFSGRGRALKGIVVPEVLRLSEEFLKNKFEVCTRLWATNHQSIQKFIT